MKFKKKWIINWAAAWLVLLSGWLLSQELPVKDPATEGYTEIEAGIETRVERGITNLFHHRQLYNVVFSGEGGLNIDFSDESALLVGVKVDAKYIYGRVYYGPYPFESAEISYAYKRFRGNAEITEGKAFLPLDVFLGERQNSENWINEGVLALRFDLSIVTGDKDYYLGIYETYARFRVSGKTYEKLNVLLEGPHVNLTTSENPTRAVISFRTGSPVQASVVLDDGRAYTSSKSTGHEIVLTGLEPGRTYTYQVVFDDYKTPGYTFRAAPPPGEDNIVFAYTGDSRSGIGSGDRDVMGVNHATLERLANFAHIRKADLFLFGGDLINGNTSSPADFRSQMHSWKDAMTGYWNHRPVFACIGNHESLLRVFQNKAGNQLRMDRWPYDEQSSETVFAEELTHPINAPAVSDPKRPSYRETAYSFQYGAIKFIAFNNNYWVTKTVGANPRITGKIGGCPEGYILPEQMDWLEKELNEAEKNLTVKYIILFAQEPVFPNGGHLGDAMWYDGDNSVRAYTWNSHEGLLVPEVLGILEVRNRLVRMIGANPKVAAVLGSDEHAYHKILIDKHVPVGAPGIDNPDLNGKVCQNEDHCSALADLKYPVWYLVSGGAGAPYYSGETTPWNSYWSKNPQQISKKKHTSSTGCYYYSSQENILIFSAGKKGISVTVYNPYGDVIDVIEDLMSIKK